jgi:hypothetical protein
MRVAKPGTACAVAGGSAKTKEMAKVESTYLIVLLPESRSWIQYDRFTGLRVGRPSKFLPVMRRGAGQNPHTSPVTNHSWKAPRLLNLRQISFSPTGDNRPMRSSRIGLRVFRGISNVKRSTIQLSRLTRSRHMRTIRRAGTISIRSLEESALCGMHILSTPSKHGP